MNIEHKIEEKKGRFIVFIDDKEAGYLKYENLPNGNLLANGTLVYDDYRDQKLGTPLFNAFIDFAKSKNLKIYPTCPYIVVMFKKHPELKDMLDEDYLATL